jgi:uncharacterized membrane protein
MFFIRDSFGTRMNTVFKFHYNAWLLLAIGSALALASLYGRGALCRGAAVVITGIVMTLGGIYPIAATLTKASQFSRSPTLDGSGFAKALYPNDFAAIDWLSDRRQPRMVVVEAVGGDYTDFARVSTFAGMPTPIGWIGHELQWRGPRDEYTQRERLVQDLYQARDPETARRLVDALQASYVFVGTLERDRFGTDVGERLRNWLPVAFQRGDALVLYGMGASAR